MIRAVWLWLLFSLSLLHSEAQILHYVYLQTEAKAPFMVKYEGRRIVSSDAGYLLMSKLEERSYAVEILSLPDSSKSSLFDIVVGKTDLGFLLKKNEKEEWTLVNLLTAELTVPVTAKRAAETVAKTEDAFTNILAEVVNTPSLKELPKPVDKEVANAEKIPTVRLLFTVKEDNLRRSSYAVTDGLATDTVMVELEYREEADKALMDKKQVQKDPELKVEVQSEQSKEMGEAESNPVIADNIINESSVNQEVPQKDAGEKEVKAVMRFCSSPATETDFFKLRKKMAGVNSDKAMLQAASRAFVSHCFTTEQVRNLSVLFLNDTGKLEFLEIAYPSVYDRDRFAELESLFSEVESKIRFRAITGKIR